MWLYTNAFINAKATVVAPITYFAVVLSGFAGWYFWDHIPTSTAFIGVFLVIASGALTLYLSAREEAASP